MGNVYLKVDEKTFMMKEECSPSLVTDELVRQLIQKFVKIDVSQWRSCLLIFHRFSKTLLYEIVTARLGYRKFGCTMGAQILTTTTKVKDGLCINFLSRYEDEGEPLLNRIGPVDET
ncbi:hypothetical protein HNY73_003827 [Argiope bruennichi]|uniref:Uncharacterized protein n=1 Tax=Argiope bruennichi TaxID=94029 RepID=A0A8T0FPV8_ARGBR|nr:hypothetical protein HNY73_003827 [Argiope bruennichi]